MDIRPSWKAKLRRVPSPSNNRAARYAQRERLRSFITKAIRVRARTCGRKIGDIVPTQMVQEVVRKDEVEGTQFIRYPAHSPRRSGSRDSPGPPETATGRVRGLLSSAVMCSFKPRFRASRAAQITISHATGPDIQERVTPGLVLLHPRKKCSRSNVRLALKRKFIHRNCRRVRCNRSEIRVRPVHDFLIGRVPEAQLR